VDFLVTTLREAGGDLVSTNQPSGRTITLPDSVVLSSHVHNHSWEEFTYVWNEPAIQVAYETDLEFARGTMAGVADDYLGDEMADRIATYRERPAETAVDLEVGDRPAVDIRSASRGSNSACATSRIPAGGHGSATSSTSGSSRS